MLTQLLTARKAAWGKIARSHLHLAIFISSLFELKESLISNPHPYPLVEQRDFLIFGNWGHVEGLKVGQISEPFALIPLAWLFLLLGLVAGGYHLWANRRN